MKPDYSIIIPAYNEERWLPATLRQVREASRRIAGYAGEIVVTDNNSEDRTAEIARAHGARVVFEPERQIARARNAGAAGSAGSYLIFVDADTLISGRLLERTLAVLVTGACCGGGALPCFEGNPGAVGRGLLRLWHALSRTFHWAAGSYLFCLREAFEELGGFDERFYAGEEIHFSRALKKWGKGRQMRVLILQEAVVSSARKLEWYSSAQLLSAVLRFALNPARLKDRRECRMWYERP